MEPFEGDWAEVKLENYDAYLEASGASILNRQLLEASHNTIKFQKNEDGTYEFCKITAVKRVCWTFKLGEESEETTADDRKFMSTITVEDGILSHRQRAIEHGDKDSLITRWIEGNELHTTVEVYLPDGEKVVATGLYTKHQSSSLK